VTQLPETILQFGTGRFLRAFADLFFQQGNDEGQHVGRVVVVQSTGTGKGDNLNSQADGYHVAVRGLDNGVLVDRIDTVNSISRALHAPTQWSNVLAFAVSPDLRFILSNTTEAGYQLFDADALTSSPPTSYPAKLTQVLWARFQAHQPALTVLACELIDRNGWVLRDLVVDLARRWQLPADFVNWLQNECLWPISLVDRIVVGPTADLPLFGKDPLLQVTEPYALWAIQRPAANWQPPVSHPSIQVVDDLTPFYLRKVRILNGIHTALVARCLSKYETVQQAMKDSGVVDWVLGLLYEEIVPAIAYRVPDVARFARQTLDRFNNPFMAHKLSDIAVNHEAKLKIRLASTRDEYEKLFGCVPGRLSEIVPKT